MPPKQSSGVINFYEKMPRDMLDKAENPNHHLHRIKLPFRMCVSAPSGSGKSNFLVNLIHLFSQGKGTFENITIVTRNKDEPLYNFFTSKCDQIQVKEGLHSLPTLDKMDKKSNHLVCIDDMILAKDQTPIINYYIRARKLNCSNREGQVRSGYYLPNAQRQKARIKVHKQRAPGKQTNKGAAFCCVR